MQVMMMQKVFYCFQGLTDVLFFSSKNWKYSLYLSMYFLLFLDLNFSYFDTISVNDVEKLRDIILRAGYTVL